MNERLRKKIELLTRLTCWDHHKTKDGYYEILCSYLTWSGETKWCASHPGYLWDYCGENFDTYEEAEADLERAVDKQFVIEQQWIEKAKDNKEEYDMIWENVPDIEGTIKEYWSL